MRALQDYTGGGADNDGPGGRAADHRRSWREPVVASGVLTAIGVDGAAGQRVVRVVNLSDGGVGMVAATPLSVDTEHDIQIAGHPDRSGRVRVVHCRPTPEQRGFEIGTQYVTND